MKNVQRILLYSALLAASASHAQESSTDSLRKQWVDTALSFRARTSALYRLLAQDSTLMPEQAIAWALPTVRDTADVRYVRQQVLVKLAQGLVRSRAGRKTEALARFRHAMTYAVRASPQVEIGGVESMIGWMYGELNRFDEASVHRLRALDRFRSAKDTVGMVQMQSELAFAFSTQDDEDKAIDLYKRNLPLVRGFPDRELDMMFRIAERYKEKGEIAIAMQWLDSAQQVIRAKGAVDREGLLYWLRGDMLLDEGHCAKALEQMNISAKAIDAAPGNPAGKSWIRSRLALAHLCAKDHRMAIALATEGLELAERNDLLKEQVDNLYPLATAYEGAGNTAMALRLLKRYHLLADSMSNAAAAARLTDAYLKADFEKQQFADSLVSVQKQADAATALQKERSRRNLLLVAGLGAVFFGAISYHQRRRTQKALHRSDELLLNILPEEVAGELKAKGHADAKHFDQVTILFTDFKGFTEASERLSPQELVEELNICFKAFDHMITARGIEKIKTIGDAYMCAGGLPDPKTSSPADVVHAALEMQAFVTSRKAERDAMGKPAFVMRVGIHTGPVVAGIVGVKKFQYDIWGDTVNTASRMESSGEVGQVNISEATYALVKNASTPLGAPAFIFTPRGKVQAKGKGEMEMYFVS